MFGVNKPERILETTRGRVLTLLRNGDMTTDELAQALGLTDNAVRAHLATLERDGLVSPRGERRDGRVGKPATVYQISPDVEPLFSKAYLPFLSALLRAVGQRLSSEELRTVMTEAGQRLAVSAGRAPGDLAQRVRTASKLLNDLGGLSAVEQVEPDARYTIQSRGCPVGAAVRERPEVCQAVVALIEEVTGAEVQSCCTRGERPSCCFEVRSDGTGEGRTPVAAPKSA